MTIVDITTALVTKPPLMALVVLAGLVFAALATAAVIHANNRHEREEP